MSANVTDGGPVAAAASAGGAEPTAPGAAPDAADRDAPGVEKLSLRLKAGWGVGSLGSATLLNAVSAMLLFYLVSVVGMGAALAGALIFVSKIYDMLTDPPMGWLSDRTHTRWGRRRPWMFIGAFVSGLSFVLLFNLPDDLAPWLLAAWVLALLLLYDTGYTMFNVPYLAMPAEMTDGYHERSSLVSWRVAFASFGILSGNVVALGLVTAGGGGLAGYAYMSWIVAGIITGAMLLCVLGTGGARFLPRDAERHPLRRQLATVLANRPFVVLASIKFVQLFGVSAISATLLFLIKSVLDRTEAELGMLYGLPNLVGTIGSMPLWLALARRVGKRNTYLVAVAGFVVLSLTWLAATPAESDLVFALRGLLLGAVTGGILLMGISMLPDTIEYDARRTGIRQEGIYSGMYSFVEKTAFAFGPLVIGVLLQAMGYDREAATQNADTIRAIYVGAAVIPAAAFALSIPLLLRYDLTEARLKAANRAV